MNKETRLPDRVRSREVLLASLPENLHAFYSQVSQDLPEGFYLSKKGIARAPQNSGVAPFCSPFRVKALVRSPDSDQWSRLIELVNPDEELIECVIASRTIDSKPRDAIATLSDRGFFVFDDDFTRQIIRLIQNWPLPKNARQVLVKKVGWTPDHAAFVLPSGRTIARSGTVYQYRLDGNPDGKEVGDLAGWREGVAALSVGNANLIFALALGFSTALLTYTDLNSVIFHLYRETSRGKTTVLQAALTIWPRIGNKVKSWDATINGLEGEISRSNSILMGLDELPKDASLDFGNMIYKVANGVGKARSEKDGSAKKRQSWQTAVISTGENSVLATLKNIGKTPTGGQGVRIIDVPADGTYGLFDELHGRASSDAFVADLAASIKQASGPAGAAFVERLMRLPVEALATELDAKVGEQAAKLQTHLGVVAGDDKTTEVRRVLRSFALIALAGEWATKMGLTGWPNGMAEEAAQVVAQRWFAQRDYMPSGQTEAIKIMRDYLVENELQFIHLSVAKHIQKDKEQPDGYRDETYFYVLGPTLPKIISNKIKRQVFLDHLKSSGHIDTRPQKGPYQFKMNHPVIGRPHVYRIRRDIFDFRDTNEMTGC